MPVRRLAFAVSALLAAGAAIAVLTLTGRAAVPPVHASPPADPVATLAVVSLADPATLDAFDAIRDEPATVAAAVALLATGPTGDQQWAAVYVLANATGHAETLLPMLTDPDATIRTLAAIGVAGQGRVEGLAVLVDALQNDELLRGSSPPVAVWEVSARALARHTGLTLGPAFDADPADRASSQTRWTDWLLANGATLTFDPATEQWSAA